MNLTLWNRKLPCKKILSVCNLFGLEHSKYASHNALPINSRKMITCKKNDPTHSVIKNTWLSMICPRYSLELLRTNTTKTLCVDFTNNFYLEYPICFGIKIKLKTYLFIVTTENTSCYFFTNCENVCSPKEAAELG